MDKNSHNQKIYEENYKTRIGLANIPVEYLKYEISIDASKEDQTENKKIYDVTNFHGAIVPSKEDAYKITLHYICNIEQYKKEGTGIFFYGKPSQKLGMSLLSVFILRAAISYGYTGLFVPFSTMCEDLDYRSNYEDHGNDKRTYYDVDFLMIDSVSKHNSKTSKICDGLADIVLSRRNDKKPTLFASYIPPYQFVDNYGEALMSYIEEFVKKIEIINDSGKTAAHYKLEDLIRFFSKQKNIYDKYNLSSDEIDELVRKFKNQYKF